DLDRGINATADVNFFGFPVLARDAQNEVLLGLHVLRKATERERFRSIELQGLCVCPFVKLQRKDSHPYQVGPMDSFEALSDYGSSAEERGSFGRPVTRTAGAIFLAG